jgi:hypothetical protein
MNLANVISLASKAADPDTQKAISGVYVGPGPDGSLLVTGTDGRLLVEYQIGKDAEGVSGWIPPSPCVVGRSGFKALDAFCKQFPDPTKGYRNTTVLEVAWNRTEGGGGTVRFQSYNQSVEVKLREGKYPEYSGHFGDHFGLSPGFGPCDGFDTKYLPKIKTLLEPCSPSCLHYGLRAQHCGRKGYGVVLSPLFPAKGNVSVRILWMPMRVPNSD